MINRANPRFEGHAFITRDEFMGVMAEPEFYNIFKETMIIQDLLQPVI
jgi:hypothetical protein